MPSSSSEPEKYSIDEMMDRLKSSSSESPEEGELVTRADGTQAIRVRKRKRRSSQPVKKGQQTSRRMRIFQISAAMILVFVAALFIGGAVIYANSSPFREGLLRKIEQASGAEVEIQQFRINPKTANAAGMTLKWPAGNILSSVTLRSLSAEVSPSTFLGKVMKGEEVSASDAVLELKYPQAGEITRHFPTSEGLLPIRFNRYRVPSLTLTLGPPTTPIVKVTKSEVSLNPETENGRALLNFYRGDIEMAGWPKLRLDRALVGIRGDEFEVINLRVLHESDSRGIFDLSGKIYPYQPDRLSSLKAVVQSFQIEGLTGPALGRLFSGRIDSTSATKSNFLSFLPTADAAPTLEITFQVSPSSQIELRGFPFLLAISQALDDPWFQSPVFEVDAGGTIHRENGIVTFRDLNFESKGRMAVRGKVSMALNQELSGHLEVGVAEAMIASSKTPRLKNMFGPPKEGFRWISLKIGGPVATPSDNFKDIFLKASAASSEATAPEEEEVSTFEQLTRPK